MAEEKGPQWAMGTPAVLFMVGVSCIGLFGLLCGYGVTPTAIPLVAVFLIAGGIATLVLGTIELRRGDILLGSIDMAFGGLIFLGLGFIFGTVAWAWANLPAALQPDMHITGYFAAGIALVLFLFLPTVGKVSWSLFLAFIVLGAAVALVAAGLLADVAFGAGVNIGAGWLFLVFALYAIYAGTAFVTNTVYQAPKLPLGGPIFK